MADPAYFLDAETTWLNAYLEHHDDEIFFSANAERIMRCNAISRLDVLQVLREGHVVSSEKINAGAGEWRLVGDDRDGRMLWIALSVEVNAIRVEVIDAGWS